MSFIKKLAGEATQYNLLRTQDIDSSLDNSSIESSPESPTSANQPFIRRLRQRPEPRQSSVRVMSLVGLKNLFFNQTNTPIIESKYDSSSDPEAQRSDKAIMKKGFRIDARVISDATIGLSDGLTVPFALTAGLSALGNTKVVIYGGFAELIAGAISMGLGGYLGAKSEAASYEAQKEETQELIATDPQTVMQDITEVFEPYNVPTETLQSLTKHLADSPKLVDFVMQFQHCEEEPASNRAVISAATIAIAYFMGGLLPLLPYFFVGKTQVYEGLYISIGVMVVALFLFGYVKTCVVVGWDQAKHIRAGCFGGIQMVVVGSAAAAAAMGLVRLFSHNDGTVQVNARTI